MSQSIKTLHLNTNSVAAKRTGVKLNVLGRFCNILNAERQRPLIKIFIEYQFRYCPLLWMFCGKQENN